MPTYSLIIAVTWPGLDDTVEFTNDEDRNTLPGATELVKYLASHGAWRITDDGRHVFFPPHQICYISIVADQR